MIINGIGPETFTYRGLVEQIGEIIGHPRPVVSTPLRLGYWFGVLFGKLMDDLLYVDAPPPGETRLTDWARKHADTLGKR